MEDGGDPVYTIGRITTGEWEGISAWKVRDDFLGVQSAEDGLTFFRMYGPMQLPRDHQPHTPVVSTKVRLEEVFRFQRWFRHFMAQPSPDWADWGFSPGTFDMTTPDSLDAFQRWSTFRRYQSPSFTLELGVVQVRGKQIPSPYLKHRALDVFGAVYASIYLDKMRGLEGRTCEREGCTNTFLTSDPRKRFCDGPGDCGAVLRMRKQREAQRLEAKNAKA